MHPCRSPCQLYLYEDFSASGCPAHPTRHPRLRWWPYDRSRTTCLGRCIGSAPRSRHECLRRWRAEQLGGQPREYDRLRQSGRRERCRARRVEHRGREVRVVHEISRRARLPSPAPGAGGSVVFELPAGMGSSLEFRKAYGTCQYLAPGAPGGGGYTPQQQAAYINATQCRVPTAWSGSLTPCSMAPRSVSRSRKA